jgi:hypothetical protein
MTSQYLDYGLRKTTRNLKQINRYPCLDSNQAPLDNNSNPLRDWWQHQILALMSVKHAGNNRANMLVSFKPFLFNLLTVGNTTSFQ